MAYDTLKQDAEEGYQEGLEDMHDRMSGDDENETFYLPSSFPGIDNYKAGEQIHLKVVGKDKDGDLEVKCVHGKHGGMEDSWENEMRDSVKEDTGSTGGGY